jgi:hypothetical protein
MQRPVNKSKRGAVLMPTVDLAAWMLRYIRPTQTVLMKMDIEGSEYSVRSTILVRAGHILYSRVKVITIEYHPDDAPPDFKNDESYHDVKFTLP